MERTDWEPEWLWEESSVSAAAASSELEYQGDREISSNPGLTARLLGHGEHSPPAPQRPEQQELPSPHASPASPHVQTNSRSHLHPVPEAHEPKISAAVHILPPDAPQRA